MAGALPVWGPLCWAVVCLLRVGRSVPAPWCLVFPRVGGAAPPTRPHHDSRVHLLALHVALGPAGVFTDCGGSPVCGDGLGSRGQCSDSRDRCGPCLQASFSEGKQPVNR